jgi:hypothetical protein
MRRLILSSALFVALCTPALAMGWTGWISKKDPGGGSNYSGAPGPIVGAPVSLSLRWDTAFIG